jgi:Outer membrane protein beta-barrel domain
MKKILVTLATATSFSLASAQFQVNPQAGITFQNLTSPGQGQNFKAALGWTLGADLRIGDRAFLQPGAFLSRNTTSITVVDSTVTKQELDYKNTNLRLRALVGYKIIDSYQFDLRVMLGPSYDVLLSKKLQDESGDAFNSGSFNIEAGLGFDMGMVSLSPMMTFGLTKVFKDNPNIQAVNSKYFTYGLTVGINIGNDDAE